jgi:hypothetical protein
MFGFPIDIPSGTTLESFITEVMPRLHAQFVREPANDSHVAVVHAQKHRAWTVTVRGATMEVEEGERDGVPLWISFDKCVADEFIADWTGPKKYLPKSAPPAGLVLLSDPRVMKRLVMASGRVELAMSDFGRHVPGSAGARSAPEGRRVAMIAGFGDAAKKGIDLDDPDVTIEAKMATLQALLEGKLAPDAALSSGDVKTRGNRFLAMQLALALAPFYSVAK